MTDPILAVCRAVEPCAFEVLAQSEAHRERVEAAHLERRHGYAPPSSDDMAQQMADEHPADIKLVVQAIEGVALLNGGRVDPNAVRDSLASQPVLAQCVGPAYSLLKKQGRLIDDGMVKSTDKKGRNEGRLVPAYRLVEPGQVVA